MLISEFSDEPLLIALSQVIRVSRSPGPPTLTWNSLINKYGSRRVRNNSKEYRRRGEGLATQIFLKNKQIFFAFFAWEQEKGKKGTKKKAGERSK